MITFFYYILNIYIKYLILILSIKNYLEYMLTDVEISASAYAIQLAKRSIFIHYYCSVLKSVCILIVIIVK